MTKLNRRQFMQLTGALAAGTTLSGCGAVALPAFSSEFGDWPAPTPETDWRILNRLSFGPTAGERQRAAEIGLAAFIEEQLAPDTLPEMDLRPRLTLRRLESLHLDPPDLFDLREEDVTRELQQASLLRAVYSPAQLYEVMINFWSDHFNIAQTKGDCAWLKTVDDREVIRPHALGNFYDLLSASAHSPAMLIYLDNQENHAGNPNENYARELLELHTLGVDSGYTQSEVLALARCFTGWTVKSHFYRGQFAFKPDRHDDGPKRVLGLELPAGLGQADAERVIELLAHQPATARFIAAKLTRRFVADLPPSRLVDQTAQVFLRTQGDLKATLRTILLSPELLDPVSQPHRSLSEARKLKRPVEFMAGALRQLNAITDAGPPLLAYLAQLGHLPFQWPTPDGYPDVATAWTSTLLTRWRFALALVSGDLPGTTLELPASQAQSPADRLQQFAVLLLGQPLPNWTMEQILNTSTAEKILLASLLSSPAFQWK
jgi:uncharacterized protein (DUF1800 family)